MTVLSLAKTTRSYYTSLVLRKLITSPCLSSLPSLRAIVLIKVYILSFKNLLYLLYQLTLLFLQKKKKKLTFFFLVERKFIKETKGNKADQNRLCYVTIQLYPSLTNPKDPQAGHGIKQKSYPVENLTEPKNQHKN